MFKIIIFVITFLSFLSLTACTPEKVEPMGTFYSLQAAYDKGFVTVDDMQKIADYQNNGLTPTDVLNEELLKEIKESWAEKLHAQSHTEATATDVQLLKYYGTYGGSVAVMLADSFTEYDGDGDSVEVAEILFIYSNINRIIIYKQD